MMVGESRWAVIGSVRSVVSDEDEVKLKCRSRNRRRETQTRVWDVDANRWCRAGDLDHVGFVTNGTDASRSCDGLGLL